MKFYPADWRADEALGVCSLAARGLWVEMLALMHNADPYGHLVVNERPVTEMQLAILARTQPDQVPVLTAELETAGVFSRTRTGIIYSRRMVRDEKMAAKARDVGKLGGNPSLSNRKEKTPEDNPPDNPTDKPRAIASQTPDARYQKEEVPPASLPPKGADGPRRNRGSRLPSDFSVPAEWISEGADLREKHGLPAADLATEAAGFPLFWTAVAGTKGVKTDWRKTWLNRCLQAKSLNGHALNGHKRTAVEKLYLGAALAVERRAREREAAERKLDSGADYDAVEPLLDS